MAMQGQCIGTAVEPLEYDFGLSTQDCSILSTSPYTNHAWCVEMPGCTWISGDTAYTPPGIGGGRPKIRGGKNSRMMGKKYNNGNQLFFDIRDCLGMQGELRRMCTEALQWELGIET